MEIGARACQNGENTFAPHCVDDDEASVGPHDDLFEFAAAHNADQLASKAHRGRDHRRSTGVVHQVIGVGDAAPIGAGEGRADDTGDGANDRIEDGLWIETFM